MKTFKVSGTYNIQALVFVNDNGTAQDAVNELENYLLWDAGTGSISIEDVEAEISGAHELDD